MCTQIIISENVYGPNDESIEWWVELSGGAHSDEFDVIEFEELGDAQFEAEAWQDHFEEEYGYRPQIVNN